MRSLINPFQKIYRSNQYSFPYKYPLTKFPFLLDLEITNICNLDCIMCQRQISKRKKGFMKFDLFKKITNEAAKNFCKGLRIIGYGEPFLNKNIFKMIKYAKSNKLFVHVTTNGIVLDKKKLNNLLDCHLDSIIFSFQGVTKEEYTFMRNNPFYDKLEENIKYLIKKRKEAHLKKPYVQVTTTILDETQTELNLFYEKWKNMVDRVDHWYTSLKDISHLRRIQSLLKRQKINEHISFGKCNEVRTKLTVFWDGNVSACCCDFNGQLIIGNLSSSTLKEIWNNQKIKSIRKILAKNERYKIPLCSNCTNKFLEKDET